MPPARNAVELPGVEAELTAEHLVGVFAEQRRTAALRHRFVAVQRGVEAGVADRAGGGVVDLLEELPGLEVHVLEQVADGVERAAEDTEALALGAYFLLGAGQQPRDEDGCELLGALGLGQLGDARPVGVREQVLAADHADHAVHEAGPGVEREVAVGAREDAAADRAGEPGAARQLPVVLVRERPPEPEIDGVCVRLEDADVQVLALARQLGAHQAHRGGQRGDITGVVGGMVARPS